MRPATPRTIAILSLLLVLFAGLGGSVQAQELTSEYSIKAAFLFNFARFVEWPSEMMARSSALNLCVFGHDPFHGELERVIREKTISNRPLVGRRISAPGDARACHIVFVSAADKAKVREVLTAVRDTSCLTVGEDGDRGRQDKVRYQPRLGGGGSSEDQRKGPFRCASSPCSACKGLADGKQRQRERHRSRCHGRRFTALPRAGGRR